MDTVVTSIPLQISVILPAYNAERHIEEAVRSILTQSFSDFELIIIDDGSTDRTVERIKKFADPRVRLLENGVNRGIVFSLNRGIDQSHGRYIARMDADDIALPRRLERMVAFMDAHPAVGLCGSWARKFIPYGPRWTHRGATGAAELKAALLFATPFVHPSVMLRRSILEEHGLRYPEGYETAEDYRLWCEMAAVTDLATIPEVLLRYRVSMASVTGGVLLDRSRSMRRREVLKRIWKEFIEKTIGFLPDDDQIEAHARFYDARFMAVSPENERVALAWLEYLRKVNVERGPFDGAALALACDRAARSLSDHAPAAFLRRIMIAFFSR